MSNIWGILEKHNEQFARELEQLDDAISSVEIAQELEAYRVFLRELCETTSETIDKIFADIKNAYPATLKSVLSEITWVQSILRIISRLLIRPVSQFSEDDRLSLKIIHWMHQSHAKTTNHPAAFATDRVAVNYDIPLYYFPFLERKSLLRQPLLFHEFGHLLYDIHRQALDQVVKELQLDILDALRPISQRNDRFAHHELQQRHSIKDTWYLWIEELFCDSVGLTVGGPAYLFAFSNYLGSSLSSSLFYQSQNQLEKSEHPVTWIRIQFLVSQAQEMGYDLFAEEIKEEWKVVYDALGIFEDNFGFYDKSWNLFIRRTLNEMLRITQPRKHTSLEANDTSWETSDTPVKLLNWAWKVYRDIPSDEYNRWERKQITNFLARG